MESTTQAASLLLKSQRSTQWHRMGQQWEVPPILMCAGLAPIEQPGSCLGASGLIYFFVTALEALAKKLNGYRALRLRPHQAQTQWDPMGIFCLLLEDPRTSVPRNVPLQRTTVRTPEASLVLHLRRNLVHVEQFHLPLPLNRTLPLHASNDHPVLFILCYKRKATIWKLYLEYPRV